MGARVLKDARSAYLQDEPKVLDEKDRRTNAGDHIAAPRSAPDSRNAALRYHVQVILTWEETFRAGPSRCGGKGFNLARLHRYEGKRAELRF